MVTFRRLTTALAVAVIAWCGVARGDDDGANRLAAADVGSPSPPLLAMPSPMRSPGPLRSPGLAPLAPPAGLPTAPPPDQIKPIEPRGKQTAPKADPAAANAAPGLDFRYLAVISGACDRLVVSDRAVPTCSGKLVNVDFGNGRVAFVFTGETDDGTVITTFSGGASAQPDRRAYRLTVDRMSTTTVGADRLAATVVVETAGTCMMEGDPTHEETRFACRVSNGGKETSARFRTAGRPEVYAGSRGGDDDADAEVGADHETEPDRVISDLRMQTARR